MPNNYGACNDFTLSLLCFTFPIISLLLSFISLFKVIALATILVVIVVALSNSERR